VPVSAAGALDERNVVASASKPVPAKNEAGLKETSTSPTRQSVVAGRKSVRKTRTSNYVPVAFPFVAAVSPSPVVAVVAESAESVRKKSR
jgi:hypothetical protein